MTGLVLSIVMLLLAIWGFFVFRIFLNATLLQWLMYNVCAPTQIIFFILVILFYKKPQYSQYLLIMVLPLTYFGTMGLFIFPWTGQGAVTTQLSHILMTLSAVWVIYINRNVKEINKKVLYWIYAAALLIAGQQWYCRVTADILKKMLNV
jgi:hypothetical protein